MGHQKGNHNLDKYIIANNITSCVQCIITSLVTKESISFQTPCSNEINIDSHIEIVMTGIVSMENKLLHQVGSGIKQYVLKVKRKTNP